MVSFMERHQVVLYLLALAVGLAASFVPGVAGLAQPLVTPALGVLLLATFLTIPLRGLLEPGALTGFTKTLLALNFLLAPLVVALLLLGLHRFVPQVPDLLVFTAALVLLAPCVDYVVTFTGLAGGAHARLLSCTPLLLLAQMCLIPLWLLLFRSAGIWRGDFLADGTLWQALPQLVAALAVVVVPLLGAALIQGVGGHLQRYSEDAASVLMVPLMVLVLALTPAAHAVHVTQLASYLMPLACLYAIYAICMGLLSSSLLRRWGRVLPAPERVALTFSAVTRNALVILPLVLGLSTALADEPASALMPLAVLTQTLVELLALTVLVALYRTQKSPLPEAGNGETTEAQAP